MTRYGTPNGSYELHSMPGCPQVCISCRAFIYKERRECGLGTDANTNRLQQMADLGYDYALATVDATNTAQIRIMEHNGWTNLASFDSSSTGHPIILYGRRITR